MACPKGTWSSTLGAATKNSCLPCGPGLYQPAIAQANESVCLRCSPGSYGTVSGAAACSPCPAGSWTGDFSATACSLCAEGKWTFSAGSMREGDCTPCYGAGCLKGGSARITFEVLNLAFSMRSAEEQSSMALALAEDVASTCGVDSASIVDLQGQSGTATVDAGGRVSMFVLDARDLTANQMAARLYSADFREMVLNSIVGIVGDVPLDGVEAVGVSAVTLKPEAFVPVLPTTTTVPPTTTIPVTTTTTTPETTSTTARRTSTTTTMTTTPASPEYSPNPTDRHGGAPAWWLFALGAGVAGVAVVACVIVVSRRRKDADTGGSVV